jgi:GAF domain-containing protein
MFAALFLPEIGAGGGIEAFLKCAMLFLVADFYVFLSARMKQDLAFSLMMAEEMRRAEAMTEITRALSSSLDSKEILYLIVTRLAEVAHAEDVQIIQVHDGMDTAEVVTQSSEPHPRFMPVAIRDYPAMLQALESKELQFIMADPENGLAQSTIAVPMVVNDNITGLIYIQIAGASKPPSELEKRFYQIMAGTAANALHNAQLLEETERRARTDFLTGLPNHRTFQATLLNELARAQRHDHPLTLLMIDLDHMKEVNDRHGHPSGDRVLRTQTSRPVTAE